MKNSRKLQTAVQAVGSTGEIILFLAGFLLGKEAFIGATILILARIVIKVAMSELMYRRHQAVILEGFDEAQKAALRRRARPCGEGRTPGPIRP